MAGQVRITSLFVIFDVVVAFVLPEDVLDATEQSLVFLVHGRRLELLLRQRAGQLFEQLLLLARQLLRRGDLHRDEQVPAPAAGDVGHTAAAQAEHLPALGAFRHFEQLLALERRYPDVAAQCDSWEVERHFAVEVVAVPPEVRMVLHVDDHIQVARLTARPATFALASEPQTLAGGDAGRHANGELPLLDLPARALARGARLGDDTARSAALAAGARDGEETLLVAQLPATVALRAGRRLRPRCRAAARTGVARLLPRDLDSRLGALGRFVEGNLEVVAQVGAALDTAAPVAAAKDVAKAEDVAEAAEDVLEAGEDVRIEAAGRGTAESGVAVTIIEVPFVGVGQDGVGLRRLLEFLLGRVVARIPVGVVLQRELAVGALDLPFAGRPRDPEHVVIIAFAHGGHGRFATLTMAGRSSRSPSL